MADVPPGPPAGFPSSNGAPPVPPGIPPGAIPLGPDGLPASDLPHDDLGGALTAIIWTLLVASGAFLALRLYCKVSRGRPWWDDIILTASWIILLVDVILTTYLVTLGYGKHIWDFPLENFPNFFLPVVVRGTFSITAIAWSKTAFGVTMLRLTTGWTRHFVWFIIITVNLSMGLTALLPWVQCKPLKASWNPAIPGECWDRNILMRFNIYSGAYSGAMDFALALLPWKLLMTLRMRKKEKIGAAVAMSMGVFAGVAALVKTAMLPKLYEPDIYESVQLMIWDTVEITVTIIAASLPVLRVLVRDARSAKGTTYGLGPSALASAARFRISKFASKSDKTQQDSSHDHLDSCGRRNSQTQGDNRSDKSILGEVMEPHDGVIVRTDTVRVEFDKRKSRDDVEMGRISRHGLRGDWTPPVKE